MNAINTVSTYFSFTPAGNMINMLPVEPKAGAPPSVQDHKELSFLACPLKDIRHDIFRIPLIEQVTEAVICLIDIMKQSNCFWQLYREQVSSVDGTVMEVVCIAHHAGSGIYVAPNYVPLLIWQEPNRFHATEIMTRARFVHSRKEFPRCIDMYLGDLSLGCICRGVQALYCILPHLNAEYKQYMDAQRALSAMQAL